MSLETKFDWLIDRFQSEGISLNRELILALKQQQIELDHFEHELDLFETLVGGIHRIRPISHGEMNVLYMVILLSTFIPERRTPAFDLQRFLDPLGAKEQNQIIEILDFFQQGNLESNLEIAGDSSESTVMLAAIFKLLLCIDASQSHATRIIAIDNKLDGVQIKLDGPRAICDVISSQAGSNSLALILNTPFFVYCDQPPSIAQFVSLSIEQKLVGVSRVDKVSEACRKILRFHFARVCFFEPGTRQAIDPEDLHDMRVATRRLRSALGTFRPFIKKKLRKHFMHELRLTGNALGGVRDIDVFLENLHHDIAANPEIQSSLLEGHWQEKRALARTQLVQHLDSARYQDFLLEFNTYLNTPFSGLKKINEGETVQKSTPAILLEHYQRVRKFGDDVANASFENLHKLRIEIKKLRYTTEFFRDVLGAGSESLIVDMKKLQDHLGALNDVVVAIAMIVEYLDNSKIAGTEMAQSDQGERVSIENYLHLKQKQLDQLRITFPDTWNEFIQSDFKGNLLRLVESI